MKSTTTILFAALLSLMFAPLVRASTLYGSSVGGELPSFWTINQNSGFATGLSFANGMADLASDWRPASFRIWGIFSSRELVQLDPATGNRTFTGVTSEVISALAFDVTTATLFGVGGSGGNFLFQIDPSTAAATTIGNTGFGPYTGLGTDRGGNLFGFTTDNTLVAINPATGVGRSVGNVGSLGISDLAVRPEDGVMFGVQTTPFGMNTLPSYRLVKIDTATAAITLVGDEQINRGMLGLAFSPVVPEPSTQLLLTIALSAMALRSKRARQNRPTSRPHF